MREKRSLFSPRLSFRPYEYPEAVNYKDAIRNSYWIHTEFNFTKDIQDYETQSETVREIVKRALISISQVEVSVKQFWGNIFSYIPKPEIGAVGVTFAESEVRHADAYSHLLDILGLQEEFETALKHPLFGKRQEYIRKCSSIHKDNPYLHDFPSSLLLFSLLIEHVSLFSQFFILMSFNKHQNLFPGISNAIEATTKEEELHGNFGYWILDRIKEEDPNWISKNKMEDFERLIVESYETENLLIQWIFEHGDLPYLTKEVAKNFLAHRILQVVSKVLPESKLSEKIVLENSNSDFSWFYEDLLASSHVDFFYKRPVSYAKLEKSFDPDALF